MMSIMRRIGLAVAVVGLVAGATGQSIAGVVLYTDRAAFAAASTGVQTIDFEGLTSPGAATSYDSSLTTSGVTFTDSSSRLFVIASDFDPGFDFGSGAYLQSNFGDGTIDIALPANVTAFGADFGEFDQYTVSVALSTGQIYDFETPGNNSYTFRGFTSDTAIASVSFTSPGFAPTLDNVSFGAAAVPEPSTLISGGIAALFGLGYGWRRRKAGATA
jgi:hypothetical protein